MVDVTNELDQLQRALLFYNSPDGILIDGDGMEGSKYLRRFSSQTMKSGDKTYFRTEEILYEYGKYHGDQYFIVYRTKKQELQILKRPSDDHC